MDNKIYLDHNATTPIDEQVSLAMQPFMSKYFANPSSNHSQGRLAKTAIEGAREQLASLINVQPEQIIFTSGGTEANNLALKGRVWLESGRDKTVAVSATEHASILEPARSLSKFGWQVKTLPVDSNGIIKAEQLSAPDYSLLSIMLANNESGTINNLSEITNKLANSSMESRPIVHTYFARYKLCRWLLV